MLYELRWSITTKVDYKVDYHTCDNNIVIINHDEKSKNSCIKTEFVEKSIFNHKFMAYARRKHEH